MSSTVSSKLTRIESAMTRIRTKTNTTGDIIEDVVSSVENLVDPVGNINITNLNSINVTNYATAQVVDSNITPSNIKLGVNILGVEGNLEPDKPDQTKIVDPLTTVQNITPDTGYELAQVTINAVTSNIDPNITAENIKNGVNILGVTGSLSEGIDTSDATAQASDIMSGMTAYVNGSKITGTIDNRRVVYKVNTYVERDALTPNNNDMCVMYNNEYLGSFVYDGTNSTWNQMSISPEGLELNNILDEVYGTNTPYEGLGGSEADIEEVFDSILGTPEEDE